MSRSKEKWQRYRKIIHRCGAAQLQHALQEQEKRERRAEAEAKGEEVPEDMEDDEMEEEAVIRREHFEEAMSFARRSVADADLR